MNYIEQLNAFSVQRKIRPLSAKGICLYFVLMEHANSIGFPERIKIPNSLICALSALSLSGLQRAREELEKEGYIKYFKGENKKECGEYEIIKLDFPRRVKYGRNNKNSDDSIGNDFNCDHNNGNNSDYNSDHNLSNKPTTYNKYNNKTNKNKYSYYKKPDRYEDGWHDYDFEDIERRALARSYGKKE